MSTSNFSVKSALSSYQLGVAKVRLQLGVWCQLFAQHRIATRKNVATIARAFLMPLQRFNSCTVRHDCLGFWVRRFPDITSVVIPSRPRQGIFVHGVVGTFSNVSCLVQYPIGLSGTFAQVVLPQRASWYASVGLYAISCSAVVQYGRGWVQIVESRFTSKLRNDCSSTIFVGRFKSRISSMVCCEIAICPGWITWPR